MDTSVMIVHSNQLVREGLRVLLGIRTDLKVVAEARDGRGAVRLARHLSPNIVLMELMLPLLSGIDATREIMVILPDTRIIGLATTESARIAGQMTRSGASSVLSGDYGATELILAIEGALTGETLPMRPHGDAGAGYPPADSATPVLTPREMEVLQLMADGRTTRQIASELIVGVKTVETHRKHIMDKLNIHSVAQLTKYAILHGLTSISID